MFDSVCRLSVRTAAVAERAGDDAAPGHRRCEEPGVAGDGSELGVGPGPARPMAVHAQDDRVGRRSVGILPVPDARGRGLEMFDFETDLLQVCGIGAANAEVCDIKVQRILTPRLGLAYRPTDDTVHSRRLLTEPAERQRDYPSRRHRAAFPRPSSTDQRTGYLHTSRLVDDRCPACAPAGSVVGRGPAPAGTGVTTLEEEFKRGTITSWNVTAQKLFRILSA